MVFMVIPLILLDLDYHGSARGPQSRRYRLDAVAATGLILVLTRSYRRDIGGRLVVRLVGGTGRGAGLTGGRTALAGADRVARWP
jgi:hypothetical protein